MKIDYEERITIYCKISEEAASIREDYENQGYFCERDIRLTSSDYDFEMIFVKRIN